MKRCLRILLIAGALCASAGHAHAQKMIQIKGSDTLINMVQRLAEVYMQKNPGKVIAVTGGGSGTGVAALINGKCDIANASRLMKDKEIAQAHEGGIDPKRIVVAIDGLCVVANVNNRVNQLTVDEVGKIFRGEIVNWRDIGGADMPITLYGRQSNSGTYEFLKEVVLKGDFSPRTKSMNGNAQIIEAIKQDVSGIGYVGVGYVKGESLNVINIASRPGGEYTSPLNLSAVRGGTYPITRPLNQYINGQAAGDIRDFILFELSGEGQRIIEEEGFFSLPDEYAGFNRQNIGAK
ncbi:MAG: phosphate ABC transporter substrate-binding protein [Candidatus Omnitrophota bacterium]